MAFFSITHTLQQRKRFIASEFEREINLTLHFDDDINNENKKLENGEENNEIHIRKMEMMLPRKKHHR